ncbi:alpha/beta superfamily hydrolase-like protein [Halenospora varia]|nr:alpha/beta superfamily hydrolase-like protein [Halenospora varia]
MPGLPPNARRETISEYEKQCGGIQWREERIRSLDGTRISLCVALRSSCEVGNASSLPPRLPFLSPVLRILKSRASNEDLAVRYVLVCCSYRGYWTSKGRPSEEGIAKDAIAALEWVQVHHDSQAQTSKHLGEILVVIWGQSIGAGVASNLAAGKKFFASRLTLETLILETPFLSIRSMLETLYPQKWLPYRYLWPFLRNHLDSWQALGRMKEEFGNTSPRVLLLVAGKDELVPASHGEDLEKRCLDVGLDVQKKVIGGALHTEVMVRQEGLSAVVDAVEKVTKGE